MARYDATPSPIAASNTKATKAILDGLSELLKKNAQIQSMGVNKNLRAYDQQSREYTATVENYSIILEDGTILGINITSPNA